MPAEWLPPDGTLPKELTNVVLITVHPDLLSGALLERVDTALVVGANALDTLTDFTRVIKQPAPQMDSTALEPGEFLLWLKESATPPQKVLGSSLQNGASSTPPKICRRSASPGSQLLLPWTAAQNESACPEFDALPANRRRGR